MGKLSRSQTCPAHLPSRRLLRSGVLQLPPRLAGGWAVENERSAVAPRALTSLSGLTYKLRYLRTEKGVGAAGGVLNHFIRSKSEIAKTSLIDVSVAYSIGKL